MKQPLLELRLLGYLFSPDRTAATVVRFRAWLHRRGRTIAVAIVGALGVLLIARGVITLAG
jgi:hypothetical protein